MTTPIVTAIVSTYSAEKFIKGCMDDLVAQTIFEKMEILVIDSGSPEAESRVCAEFAERYPDQIVLIRTEREPLYVAWNRGIKMARGRYLTSANTDDRHAANFMEEMTNALDNSADVALVYANQYISHLENETFEECVARGASIRRWPEYTPEDLLMRCITGSQPMWRKSLHLATGEFDTDYSIAADYDLWLRIASTHKLLHVGQTLGVLYDSPNTISGANSRIKLNQEILALKREHMENEPWLSVKLKIQKQLAASFYGMAYQLISVDSSGKSAAGLLKEALRLDPFNLKFAKTYLLRCVLGIGRFYK